MHAANAEHIPAPEEPLDVSVSELAVVLHLAPEVQSEDAAAAAAGELDTEDDDETDRPQAEDDGDDEELAVARRAARETVTADSAQMYLKEIGKYPLLTAEQEVEISKRIEAGLYAGHKLTQAELTGERLSWQRRRDLSWIAKDGAKAKEEMLNSNLRLVVSLAKRYTGHGMPFLDLIEEGNIGLIRAVEKFDYTKGFKFSTYATWWIRQALTRSLADQARTIRVPVHVVEIINKAGRIKRELGDELGREPTDEEWAKEVDITTEKLKQIREYDRDPVSLDQDVGDGSGAGRGQTESVLGDYIQDKMAVDPPDAAIAAGMAASIAKVLDQLDERESRIIRFRFGLFDGRPWTLDEIGQEVGVTRERIRQVEIQALAKLRESKQSTHLRDYLR